MARRYFLLLLVAATSLVSGCKRKDTESMVSEINEHYLYASDTTGTIELWKVDGKDKEQLTFSDDKNNWWPRISPDGEKVLFYASPVGQDLQTASETQLLTTNLSGTTEDLLLDVAANGWYTHAWANWSNDGKKLAMCVKERSDQKWKIGICDSKGENFEFISTRSNVHYLDPVFGPDDKHIYCSTIPADLDSLSDNYEIFEIDIQSGSERRLTFNETRDQHPCLNDAGDKIVFETLSDPSYLTIGKWSLNLLDLNNLEVDILLEDENLNLSPRFSKDGNSIFFIRFNILQFHSSVYKYDLDKHEIKALSDDNFNAINVDPI